MRKLPTEARLQGSALLRPRHAQHITRRGAAEQRRRSGVSCAAKNTKRKISLARQDTKLDTKYAEQGRTQPAQQDGQHTPASPFVGPRARYGTTFERTPAQKDAAAYLQRDLLRAAARDAAGASSDDAADAEESAFPGLDAAAASDSKWRIEPTGISAASTGVVDWDVEGAAEAVAVAEAKRTRLPAHMRSEERAEGAHGGSSPVPAPAAPLTAPEARTAPGAPRAYASERSGASPRGAAHGHRQSRPASAERQPAWWRKSFAPAPDVSIVGASDSAADVTSGSSLVQEPTAAANDASTQPAGQRRARGGSAAGSTDSRSEAELAAHTWQPHRAFDDMPGGIGLRGQRMLARLAPVPAAERARRLTGWHMPLHLAALHRVAPLGCDLQHARDDTPDPIQALADTIKQRAAEGVDSADEAERQQRQGATQKRNRRRQRQRRVEALADDAKDAAHSLDCMHARECDVLSRSLGTPAIAVPFCAWDACLLPPERAAAGIDRGSDEGDMQRQEAAERVVPASETVDAQAYFRALWAEEQADPEHDRPTAPTTPHPSEVRRNSQSVFMAELRPPRRTVDARRAALASQQGSHPAADG